MLLQSFVNPGVSVFAQKKRDEDQIPQSLKLEVIYNESEKYAVTDVQGIGT